MSRLSLANGRAWLVAPALVVALLALGIARLAAPAPVAPPAVTGAPAGAGYPGPTAPTAGAGAATATPAAIGGVYPPPDVPHEIVSLHALPAAPALLAVASDLAAGDSAALAARIGEEPLGLDPIGDTEGFGVRLRADDLQSLLAALFAAGSAPVIQGAFGEGCVPRQPTCSLHVVVTGWEGVVPFPTRDPSETIGRRPPSTLPTGAAVWELVPDSADGLWWRSWRVAAGYHEAVARLAETHGTYYVVR